jgi:hypothetical protein
MVKNSEDEKLRRQQRNEDILGTHAMEGLFPDTVTSDLLDRFAQGELASEQLSEALDRHAHALFAARPVVASAA